MLCSIYITLVLVPCKAMAHSHQSSYTSNYLIAKRDEYPCHAKQWPTPTSIKSRFKICIPATSNHQFRSASNPLSNPCSGSTRICTQWGCNVILPQTYHWKLCKTCCICTHEYQCRRLALASGLLTLAKQFGEVDQVKLRKLTTRAENRAMVEMYGWLELPAISQDGFGMSTETWDTLLGCLLVSRSLVRRGFGSDFILLHNTKWL